MRGRSVEASNLVDVNVTVDTVDQAARTFDWQIFAPIFILYGGYAHLVLVVPSPHT